MTRRFRLGALERLRAGKLAEAARALGSARTELAEVQEQRARLQSELLRCDGAAGAEAGARGAGAGAGGAGAGAGGAGAGAGGAGAGAGGAGAGAGGAGAGAGVEPFSMGMAASRRERLREDLLRAGERLSTARSREVGALAGWNAARSDLRAVETLHERHRLSVAEADARSEQRALDEFAGTVRRPDHDPFGGGDPS